MSLKVASSPKLPSNVTQESLQWVKDVRQQMLVIPTWAAENSHIPSPWAVGYNIFGFSSLKMGKLTFTWKPLLAHADLWLLQDALITVKCTELWSFPLSDLQLPVEYKPLVEPLGILGALCHWDHLPYPMMCQAFESLVLLTSPSDVPSSRPYIQSSTLQAPAKDWTALPEPQRHPGPLAFVFLSMTASTIAWQPSWTVFTVASTCAVFPAQLTWPAKLNLMSLAL